MTRFNSFALQALASLGMASLLSASNVGEKAPPVEPSEWVNAKGSPTWASFRGQLILVEKWATWCGPCRQTIPHLNQLHQEYGKKGLVVIGVSDEAAATIKPFVTQNSMSYLVAVGGAKDYQTDGIPHGWLVNPQGQIVWEGHPASLTNGLIEEHLKGVRFLPEFRLPRELKSAQTLLDSGKFGQGIKELDHQASKPDEKLSKAAKEALEQVRKYGEERLALASDLIKDKDYADALQTLTAVEKGFSGHELSAKAKSQRTELAGKPEVKLEIAAAEQFDKARDLIRQKKFKAAAAILTSLTDSKKAKETRAGQRAEAELKLIRGKY